MAAPLPAGLRPLALLTLTWFGQPGAMAEESAAPPPQKLSARLHEVLTQSLPKYSPPKPAASPTSPTTDEDVLVLTPIKVTRKKPLLDPFALLSNKGHAALALKQSPSFGFGPSEDFAVEILTQEREAAKRSAVKEAVTHLATLDPIGMAEEIKLMRAATTQPNRDWATSSGQNKNPNSVTIRPPPYPDKKRR